MNGLPEVEIIATEAVSDLLHTTSQKINAAILNGTFPVGIALERDANSKAKTIIIKERLIAWLTAQDLKGG